MTSSTTKISSSTRRQADKLALPALALCSAFVGLDSIITVPLIPTIAATNGFSESLGGLLVTAYALVYAITAPFFGSYSDHWGRKRMIFLGLAVLALGTALTGFSNNLGLTLLFRAVTGLGAGILEPAVLAMAGDIFPYEQRGRAMGVILGSLVAAATFGLPVGGFLAQFSSWHWVFWSIGLLVVLMSWLIAIGLPQDATHELSPVRMERSFVQTMQEAFSQRSVIVTLLSTLLWFGALHGLFANIGYYYEIHFHISVAYLGLILMGAGAAGILGSIIGGRLADRFGKKTMLGSACISVAVLVILFTLVTQNLLLAIVINFVWSALFNVGQASLSALASELRPEIRGVVLSLNSSAMYIGSTLTTAISALFLQIGGGFLSLGFICALACLLAFFLMRTLRIEYEGKKEIE